MKLKLSYIICAVLVPLVMMITLALLVSVLQFKQDVALSAKTLLRFSEDVPTASWRVTGQAVKLADRPCAEILSELNRTRAFTPYIRDIGLLEKGNLLCSFVSREQAHPFPLPPVKRSQRRYLPGGFAHLAGWPVDLAGPRWFTHSKSRRIKRRLLSSILGMSRS